MKFYSAWNRKTLSLRQYAAIVDSSDDAIIGQTPDGIITGWNPAAVRLFGHSAAEAVGNPIAMIYPPDRLDEGADLLRRIATGETIARFDSVRVRKNASVVDVSVTLAPITDGRGRIIGALNLAHDISARLQSEQSLRHYAAIVESADDAIVGKTLDGTITSWNAGAERIFGFSRGEALGAPISIIIPELFAAEEYALLQRIHDGEPIQHYQTIRRHKNGRLLDISVSVSPIRDHRGQIVGACKIARNLNDATLQANHRLLDATVTVLRPGLAES